MNDTPAESEDDDEAGWETAWHKRSGGEYRDLYVDAYKVTWQSNTGTPMSEYVGSTSHAAFLKGEGQDEVMRMFGKVVLQRLLETVKHASEIPRFQKDWDDAKARLGFWKAIPIDASLAQLAIRPDEDGKGNYCNIRKPGPPDLLTSYESVIKAPNGEFHINLYPDSLSVFFLNGQDEPVWSVPAKGHWAGLFYKDHFYLAGDHLQIVSLEGNERFSTTDIEDESGLGSYYRIVNVLRKGDRVFGEYRDYWFGEDVPEIGTKGYLEVNPDQGIVARSAPLIQEIDSAK